MLDETSNRQARRWLGESCGGWSEGLWADGGWIPATEASGPVTVRCQVMMKVRGERNSLRCSRVSEVTNAQSSSFPAQHALTLSSDISATSIEMRGVAGHSGPAVTKDGGVGKVLF